MAQPMYEMGREAMKMLEELRESESLEMPRRYMEHKIVERESVRSI